MSFEENAAGPGRDTNPGHHQAFNAMLGSTSFVQHLATRLLEKTVCVVGGAFFCLQDNTFTRNLLTFDRASERRVGNLSSKEK